MKALALFSGGLDSMVAIRLMQNLGIEVVAVSYTSPFFGNKEKLLSAAKANGFDLKVFSVDKGFIDILKRPKHGYGKNLNPCIDCKIFMLTKAKGYAEEVGAKFIFTGEVAGQRPMSQGKETLLHIEREAGLEGKLLRPLSAKVMPLTEAEKEGWVDREKLLGIFGRGRNKQTALAREFGLKEYGSPAGGCLLTHEEYAAKAKDILTNESDPEPEDFYLLKIGRHFRFNKSKVIVGRNKDENELLLKDKSISDYSFEPVDIKGPVAILKGEKTNEAVTFAAELVARYSDAKALPVKVKYDKGISEVKNIDKEKIEESRLV